MNAIVGPHFVSWPLPVAQNIWLTGPVTFQACNVHQLHSALLPYQSRHLNPAEAQLEKAKKG